MKVTFVAASDNLAGGNRVVGVYANHLRSMGHEVSIVLPAPRVVPKYERVIEALRTAKNGSARGAVAQLRQLRAGRPVPGFLERSGCRLTPLASFRPVQNKDVPDADVVVATWWETAHWVAGFEESKGAKAYFMQDYGAPGQELEKLIPTWKLGFHMVTISRWLRNLVKEHAPGATIEVVENAVDHTLFHQPPRAMPSQPTVGFVYREDWVKGYDIALRAYRLAKEEVPDLRFVAFGVHPRSALSHFPAHLDYHARPTDREIVDLYGSCTAWLFASRLEGFGLPILEAMACRTPVIATRAGAAPELIERGGGWLIDVDDARAMADAIVEACLLSPDQWLKASQSAYWSVRNYTSWEDAGNAFAAVLERAVRGASEAPLWSSVS